MRRRFVTLDVFTGRRFAGNPLAIVLDAEAIDTGAMQAIAREFNLAETVFTLPPQDPAHRARLRIFTPAVELPFAGHPTIGTAVLLNRLDGGGERGFAIEEGIGAIRCTTASINGEHGSARFELARLPEELGTAASVETIAAALGVEPDEIGCDNFRPSLWSAGIAFTFVPVRSLDVICRCQPKLDNWEAAFRRHDRSSAYVFCRETVESDSAFHARMFGRVSGSMRTRRPAPPPPLSPRSLSASPRRRRARTRLSSSRAMRWAARAGSRFRWRCGTVSLSAPGSAAKPSPSPKPRSKPDPISFRSGKLSSRNISLLRVSVSDLPFIMTTERTPDFEQFVGRWSEDEHLAALASPSFAYFLGTPADERPIGFVILRDLADFHGNICLQRIAVTHPGQGFGMGLARATIDWVFRHTSANRLWLDVVENNGRAKHVYSSLGFISEGVLRQAFKLPDGVRVNLIRMSILEPDWKKGSLCA